MESDPTAHESGDSAVGPAIYQEPFSAAAVVRDLDAVPQAERALSEANESSEHQEVLTNGTTATIEIIRSDQSSPASSADGSFEWENVTPPTAQSTIEGACAWTQQDYFSTEMLPTLQDDGSFALNTVTESLAIARPTDEATKTPGTPFWYGRSSAAPRIDAFSGSFRSLAVMANPTSVAQLQLAANAAAAAIVAAAGKRKPSSGTIRTAMTSSQVTQTSSVPSPATTAQDSLSDVQAASMDDQLAPDSSKEQVKHAPKAKGRKRKASNEATADATADPLPKPARKKAVRRKKQAEQTEATTEQSDADPTVATTEAGPSEAGEEVKPKKTRKPRKPKVKEPIVYVIPPVEQKTTAFRGRLGYACLNTILRKEEKPSIFCSRTCRIDTIKKEGMDFLKELGRANIKDLVKIIEWNHKHHIHFFRLSSEMFPFASHPEYGYNLEYCAEELKEAGDLARKYGMRLTTHPGQFTQLGSPRKVVVDNAFRDLTYHCEMLDRMGMDQDSVMIIHGGGVYGDKEAALARIRENYPKLPENVKGRLVLENDELSFNCDDLLPLCEELNIPLVFDWHHDWIFPSSQTPKEMMPRIQATWDRKGIRMKQHLSEPRPGAVNAIEKRAHSDRIQNLPADLPPDCDAMIEAKDKEQSVFHIYRMYNLAPTIYDSLRPPAENETLRTNGRKSNKRKKKLADEDDEEHLEDVDDETAVGPELDVSVDMADEKAKVLEQVGTGPVEDQGETLVEPEPVLAGGKKRDRKVKASVKPEDGFAEVPKMTRGRKAKQTPVIEAAAAAIENEVAEPSSMT
ncbi:hypothetical protein OIV83_001676 [Microbotryomycetes sp. JL201]|nr:hypothetical protein OIV83_001676 [Microbotryomycetes sp. JL201]